MLTSYNFSCFTTNNIFNFNCINFNINQIVVKVRAFLKDLYIGREYEYLLILEMLYVLIEEEVVLILMKLLKNVINVMEKVFIWKLKDWALDLFKKYRKLTLNVMLEGK